MGRVSNRVASPPWGFYSMNTMLIQFILVAAMLVALYVTWKRARQNVISTREAIGWSVIWVGAGVVVALPDTASAVARIFGVGRGVDLVLYASVAVLFLLVFKVFIQHERMERMLTELVRLEALRMAKDELASSDEDEEGCGAGECCGGHCHET